MSESKFKKGDFVRKTKGSWWEGRVVGFYDTADNPDGVAVQLEKPNGPVQIYPAAAMELVPAPADQMTGSDPVRWQRRSTGSSGGTWNMSIDGWVDVPEEDISGYRERGQEIRALYTQPAPANQMRATDSFGNDVIERELVSIVLRMSRHLLAVDTPAAKKLNEGALDYLRRKGLMPSPLRAEETVVQSATEGSGE